MHFHILKRKNKNGKDTRNKPVCKSYYKQERKWPVGVAMYPNIK